MNNKEQNELFEEWRKSLNMEWQTFYEYSNTVKSYFEFYKWLLTRKPNQSTECFKTPVVASKQKVKCANCSREIETYKNACAPCRIADALLD